MRHVWAVFTETLLEAAGVLALPAAAVAVAVTASPRVRKGARRLGVRAMAGALAARDLAAGQLNRFGADGGVTRTLASRLVQMAAEAREECEDVLAEARALKAGRRDVRAPGTPARDDQPVPPSSDHPSAQSGVPEAGRDAPAEAGGAAAVRSGAGGRRGKSAPRSTSAPDASPALNGLAVPKAAASRRAAVNRSSGNAGRTTPPEDTPDVVSRSPKRRRAARRPAGPTSKSATSKPKSE